MESRLLHAVLSGKLQLSTLTPWMLSETDSNRLPQDAASPQSQGGKQEVFPLAPSGFRACVLSTVREEAEALFFAAEQALESGTPRQQDQVGLSLRLTPDRQFSDRLPNNPGSLDESNFPTLGAASQLLGKGKSTRVSAGALMRLVTPETRPSSRAPSAASSTRCRAAGHARTRIAPTAVQEVQRDARFVAEPSRQAGQRQKIAPTPISSASRDASVTQSQDPLQAAASPGGNLSAASSNSTSAWGQRQPSLFSNPAQEPNARESSQGAGAALDCSHRNMDAERQTSGQSPEARAEAAAENRSGAMRRWGSRSDALLSGLRAESESPGSRAGSTGKLQGRSPSPTSAWEARLTGGRIPSPVAANIAHSSPSPANSRGASALAAPLLRDAKAPRSQGGSPVPTSGKKPLRSQSPTSALPGGKGDARSSSRGRRDSPGTTPQSRFRPLQTADTPTEGLRSASPELHALENSGSRPAALRESPGMVLRSPAGQSSGTAGSKPTAPANSPAPDLHISFHNLRLSQADAEPCTPKLAPARQSWAPPGAQSSPQGSVYYTGSEGEEISPSKPETEVEFCDAASDREDERLANSFQVSADKQASSGGCAPVGSISPDHDCLRNSLDGQRESCAVKSGALEVPVGHQEEHVSTAPQDAPTVSGHAATALSDCAARQIPGSLAKIEVSTQDLQHSGADIAAQAQESGPPPPVPLISQGAALGERTLSEAGLRLAELHAQLLALGPGVALAPELSLLLHLLTVPPEVACLEHGLLWCGDVAAAFVCTVLLAAGRLVESLGVQMLEALHESPAVAKHSPELQARVGTALQRQQPQVHERGVPVPGVLSLMAFTSDGLSKRTPEEQRRVSNREMCRDELLALLREASGAGQTFTRQQPQMLNGPGNEDAAFGLLQNRVPALLRRLAPENFGHLAELFTAAVLQAAATGEALLDEELSSLARQDVSRFERLNQRMQAQPGGRPPGRLPVSPASSGTSFPAPSQAFSGARSMGSMGRAPPAGRGPAGKPSPEGLDLARTVVAEFTPALRLYVLFLEAADSHRLNVHLTRCMVGKLKLLADESDSLKDSPASSQQVAAMAALAGFLSYLSFAAATAAAGTPLWESRSIVTHSAPTVDIATALQQASGPQRLLRTSLWVARYLWFLPWDPGSAASPYFTTVLQMLSSLQRSTRLRPGSEGFGTAELCLRSVLDDALGRFGPAITEVPAEHDLSGRLDGSGADAVVDVRLMQLSCPLLEQSQRALQASTAGRRGNARPGGMRKITPSVPSAPVRVAEVPDSVAAAAAGCVDPAQLALQRAFLDMYSTAEHKVSLRDIVTRTADIVGHNASTASMGACVPPAVKEAAEALAERADTLVQGRSGAVQAEALQALLMPLAEQLIARAVWQALADCQEMAHKSAERKVVAALVALAHPDWTEAIVGTAAAIAAQSAQAVCAKRLIMEVPSRVRALVTAQAKAAVSRACKKRNQALNGAAADAPGAMSELSAPSTGNL